jgi:hypothetical protein
MKKFLAGFVTAVALSFFVFPTDFTFLPSAINSKMIMAGWGVLVFLYRSIREKRVEIPRIVLVSGVLAALFSLWCLIAVTLTETYNMEYVSYIKSFLTWVLGALGACAVMKFCTGKDDLPTLTKYLAIVCVSQCALALMIDNIPFVSGVVDEVFSFAQDFYRTGGRLYGIGCALDVAGVRFSAILLLMAHQIATNAHLGEKNLSIVTMLSAFFVTMVVGAMISRTTVVGAALGLAYMALVNLEVTRGGYVSSRQVRVFLVGVVTLLIMGAVAVYLYQSSQAFYENVRFGFEGFFNWVETGEFRTGSTDHLKTMWVWPTTPRGWWIGEGIVGVYQTNSDIGYCNFILYCGLIGMVIYSLYYIYNHLCLNEKYDKFVLLSLLMVALTFIIWAKVQTDIFFLDALLFCARGDVKYYSR